MAKALRSQPSDGESPFAGLRFAVYARKSTEDARHEDHKSTARQVEQAKRYVESNGGEILADCRYVDEDVSGAEFRSRPGLLRFLDTLRNGKPFNAVVMSEQSRLGREQLETGYLLKQIRDAGIRVFYYLTDEEARLDSALDKIMSSLTAFAGEMEREKARQRCRDAAERKARQGHVSAGRCFGYDNVPMRGEKEAPEGSPRDYVTRRVNEAEARILRGIFQAYADGYGMVKIAKTLNLTPDHADLNRHYFGGRKIPTPWGRASGWSPTLIREMLYRRIYRGEIVWGRRTHTDRDGRAGVVVKRDEQEWVRREAPALRIVDEALWQTVQDRLKVQAGIFLRDGRGKLWGKPDRQKEGNYLLSGLAQCGLCGERISVVGGVPRVYACTGGYWKGVCENRLTQRVSLVDAAFLAALEREVLTPERFAYAVRYGVERVREELTRDPGRRPALEQEKTTLARKIERMVKAIGDGKGPAALVQEIAKAEARLAEIEAELGRIDAAPALANLDLGRIERDVAGQLSRFTELLKGNVPRARQALKKLLMDRLVFTPIEAGSGRKTYRFTGALTYGAILREITISAENLR